MDANNNKIHIAKNLKNIIEKMDSIHHEKILNIFDNYNAHISENRNGCFINITDIVQIVYFIFNGIPSIDFDFFPNGEGCDEQKDIIQLAINSAQQNNSNLFFVHETEYCIDNTIFVPSCMEINFKSLFYSSWSKSFFHQEFLSKVK